MSNKKSLTKLIVALSALSLGIGGCSSVIGPSIIDANRNVSVITESSPDLKGNCDMSNYSLTSELDVQLGYIGKNFIRISDGEVTRAFQCDSRGLLDESNERINYDFSVGKINVGYK